jgi:hypothetical protein
MKIRLHNVILSHTTFIFVFGQKLYTEATDKQWSRPGDV